ncbi:MAG: GGDEF domain-containing protein [Telmatospirillum sp.]|nr:GGDEF domain-containing protein [Telmatospirillum sp.]
MRRYLSHLPTLIVFLASVLATLLAWQHEKTVAVRDLQSALDYQLRQTTSRIEQRMAAYEQMLRGVQGLFAATGEIGHDAFSRYVDALQLGADFAGIQGIGLVPLVRPGGMAALNQRARAGGLSQFHVWPDGEREFYAPFLQIEPPFGRNLSTVGFDLFSDPERRTLMEQARDSGNAVLSGRLRLGFEEALAAQPGFLMVLPVYRTGQRHDSPETRRAALAGWVVGIFRMGDLIASLYGEGAEGIVTEISDGTRVTPESRLFLGDMADGNSGPWVRSAEEIVVIAGHSWTVTLHATKAFDNHPGRDMSVLILLTGLSLSVLLTVVARQMATARERAREIAEEMTRELKESEACWRFALEGAGDGVWDWHVEKGEIRYSHRWKAILGSGDGVDDVRSWTSHIHPEDLAEERNRFEACLAGHATIYHSEHRIRWPDGSWRWMEARGMVVSRDGLGVPLRMIGTVSDVSERRETEDRIRHLAQHDPLTGLPNRALFSDRLQTALSRARRNAEHVALMFVDLDRFKPVNDTHGHGVGDLLLKEVADRMRGCVRDSDTVARIGGDEFVVLLPAVGSSADALQVAEKIRAALCHDFLLAGERLLISASIGVALFPENGVDAIELSKNADDAMYRAKQQGRNRIQVFRDGITGETPD